MEQVRVKIGCEAIIIENNMLLLGKRKNCFGEKYVGTAGWAFRIR